MLALKRSIPTEKVARRGMGPERALVGVVGGREIGEALEAPARRSLRVADLMQRRMVVTHPDDTLRRAADEMAASRVGVLPVVGRDAPTTLLGLVSTYDLFRARTRLLEEERHRAHVLRLRLFATPRQRGTMPAPAQQGGSDRSAP